MISERRLHSTRLKAEWIEFDAAESLFRACFRDGTKGKTLHMVSVGWDGEPALHDTVDDLVLRGDIVETRFQVDKGGRFHLVFAASGGSSGESLYAWNRKRGLMRLAKDQERYFPMVMAAGRIYFGYYRKGSGYRFVELNLGFGPRIREYR
ncbi:MAG: hypothetical protein M3Y08_07250 [Fibrobacterota bacterium]|nr:hypothetical protein [Fibrobacterota bacterium]